MNEDNQLPTNGVIPAPDTAPISSAPPPVTPSPVPPSPLPQQEEPPEEEGSPLKDRIKGWLATGLILLAAPLAALLLTAFVFQSYEVDGPSMESTLQHNDRLIVLKLGRTWSRITRKPYLPDRGEVVIFVKHGGEDDSELGDKQLIKRVIALPGERVVIKDGVVNVFNEAFPNGFQPDKVLPYGTAIESTEGNQDITVGQGELFVLGDNRANSLDSRAFGPVKAKDIVGELVLRLFPLNKIDKF